MIAPEAAVAALGLAGTGEGALPGEPLDDQEWTTLLAKCRRHRTVGLLAGAVTSGELATTDDQRRDAAATHRREMTVAVLLDGMLLDVVSSLESEGIEHRVLKGAALAHLDYPDPSLRCYSDVDLLVSPEQWDAAVHHLDRLGYHRQVAEPRPGFDRRFTKGATLTGPAGFELDLHRTFSMGPFGLLVQLDDLWAGRETFQLAGRELSALDPECRLLHACFHAALGDIPPRLLSLRDVMQIHTHDRLDLDRVAALTRAWEVEAVVARAAALATDTLGAAPSSFTRWAATLAPSRKQRWMLDRYLDRRESTTALALAAVRAIPGARAKAKYVWSLAFPTDEFVAERHRGRLARFGYAARVWTRLKPGR